MSLSGVVWRRAAAQRVVLAAAFATIMLATTALAMTSLYVQSVGESGLRRALTQAPLGDRTMEVRDSVDSAASLDDRDQQVRRAVGAAFAVVGAEVHASAVSSSYALPTRRGAEVTDLTVFVLRRLLAQGRLVAGRWPSESRDGIVAVAISQPAARARGLGAGDTLTVVNRSSDEPVEVRVSGVYEVSRPGDAFWLHDPLGVQGVQSGGEFTTYGPLVVPRATFVGRFSGDSTARWRVDPQLAGLGIGDLSALRSGVEALGGSDRAGTLADRVHELSDGVSVERTAPTSPAV